jgi:hypothetical protein
MITKAFDKWWEDNNEMVYLRRLITNTIPTYNKYLTKYTKQLARACFVAGWIASSYHPIVKETKDDNS